MRVTRKGDVVYMYGTTTETAPKEVHFLPVDGSQTTYFAETYSEKEKLKKVLTED